MKVLITFLMICLISNIVDAQGISINQNGVKADSSAILDISSQSQGVLVPRMTSSKRDSINNPKDGLLVFDTNLDAFVYYLNNKWYQLQSIEVGASEGSYYFFDSDLDTYGNIAQTHYVPYGGTPLTGYVGNSDDCDDDNIFINPLGVELCDQKDNDCNPVTADGADESILGDPCDGIDSDLCIEGQIICSFGELKCSDLSSDDLDLCDGIDNDCNPATTDGHDEPTLGNPCDGADPDFCQEGVIICQSGFILCSDNTGNTAEICSNGIDDDCDGLTDGADPDCGTPCPDLDNDGYPDSACGGSDCDDADDSVFPGAPEICDGQDNNCDGQIPSGENDTDNDGYVACSVDSQGWDGSSGVIGGDDCDDNDDLVYPGAPEICDGKDNDCSGQIRSIEIDNDLDGYVECSIAASGWMGGSGVIGGNDCDDDDNLVYPGASEIVDDGIDQNCDGSELCYKDTDNDGYRPDAFSNVVSSDLDCYDSGEALATDPEGDCNDNNSSIYPGATELCDGIDNDCNPATTDGHDEPSLGNPCDGADSDFCQEGVIICQSGLILCSDNTGNTAEICSNGIDDDCDGLTDGADPDCSAPCPDLDNDGFTDIACGGSDCDDGDNTIYPGATEIVDDGIDQDCDAQETCYQDQDNDGYRPDGTSTTLSSDMDCNDSGEADSSNPTGDCHDNNANINPAESEICNNGIDDDCNGLTDCVSEYEDPACPCSPSVPGSNSDGLSSQPIFLINHSVFQLLDYINSIARSNSP